MDVTDTCGKHGHAQIGDHLAFVGISAFTCAHNAVFLTADSTDLCFQRDALGIGQVDQLGGLLNVFFDGIVRTVEHNRREARFDASESTFIGAVVQMESHGNGDAEIFQHAVDHADDGLIAAHIFARTFGNTEDHGGIHFLRGEQNCLGPFKVVDVELTDGVMAFFCFGKHFFCRN